MHIVNLPDGPLRPIRDRMPNKDATKMKKNQHIVPHSEGWAVKTAGASRATVVVPTQQEAFDIGRGIARNNGSELFVHGRDGRIRERNSYGNDPNPPKG